MKKYSITLVYILLFILFSFYATAQTNKQIIIETKNTALIYTIGDNQRLYQSYFGQKLNDPNEYSKLSSTRHEAYIAAGMEDLFEPAIRIIHADGNPSLVLEYVNDNIDKQDGNVTHTSIKLKDPEYPVEVTLHFTSHFNEDIIKAWTEINHDEKKPVTLTNFASSMLHFDTNKYWLTQFTGDYAAEMRMKETQLASGIKILDSKLGTRAHMYRAPVFFLSMDTPAEEAYGELIAGTLAWTGNFQFAFEVDRANSLRVISGMNPYASEYKLQPGKSFITPAFIFTYTKKGKGQASRNLHDWARDYGVLDGNKPRLTLLNNWEATYTDFDEKQLVELFDGAAKLGVDLFLLDDGWFGNKYPRNNDRVGLGDWQENKTKLPSGIGYLVQEAEKKGLKFGIWLEPEMINPQSELYEKHPEWVLKLLNRDEHYFRHQLVLDLINPKVQDFVYNVVDDLLTENPGIAFIKWDANRMMTNTYSPYLKDKQSHLYIEYTRSLYEVMDRIRKKYPHLPIMLCAGGGGRTDYGALQYFTEFWPSDNTDGLERVFIQWDYLSFFPALTVSAHVTSMGDQPLKFRTDVAMMGKMGYDIRVNEMRKEELEFSSKAVETYNRISDVIWFGDLYKLISPYKEDRAVLMYVDEGKSKAVLFNYILNPRRKEFFEQVLLQGLDPEKKYRVREINLFPGTNSKSAAHDKVYSGDYLMNVGLDLTTGRVRPVTSNVFEITEESND